MGKEEFRRVTQTIRLRLGDSLVLMAKMGSETVDVIVCDPPYG